MTPTKGFEPPPYPYHRLRDVEKLARSHDGGMVDCSVGTPCDPPAPFVLEAMAASGTERGYPESAGSLVLRKAASGWIERRFGVTVAPEAVSACVGTKEFVASVCQYLHLRDPDHDVVLYPAVSYPTYAMGALLAGCRPVAVPPATPEGSGLALDRVDPADAGRALLLWANSPSNPTGGLSDLGEAAAWGRAHGVPVLSDECYGEYTWAGRPRSILEHGTDGVLAVHSLSKRSNLAGVRAGFYAGDPALVTYLTDLRRHAGLMVPGPVQAGAAAALGDDAHVEEQRARYLERLEFLASVLSSAGCPAGLPEGGFYLWVATPPPLGDGWALTEELARAGGLLVSPGEFYGPGGANFVRVAAVQPMERLRLVADRLTAAGWSTDHPLSAG
ncbi:MAG TPA: aminotransferase class I/II-fold pyridoxal phosphate-dependent enzyme [Acidimicrobiales bacterium]|nr:aminotransferase class I/II-fold pyridoxal phosphate-dependent enzyme [Acidimicrobiales bacterium]